MVKKIFLIFLGLHISVMLYNQTNIKELKPTIYFSQVKETKSEIELRNKLQVLEKEISTLKSKNEKKPHQKIFDGFLNSITIIIFSFINLLILIWQLKRNIKKEEENKKNERKSYWYRKIILEKNIEYIIEFFKESNEKFNKMKSAEDDDYKALRTEHLKKQNQYKQFLQVLTVFDDKKLIDVLQEKMHDHEDILFDVELEENDYLEKSVNIEKEIIGALYNYELNNFQPLKETA